MDTNPNNDPITNFEYLWKTIDQKYSFFDIKNVDWQLVHDTFASRISSSISDEELFDLMSEMLYVLRDGHVNLISDFDVSRNWRFYLDRPQNFDYELLERNYLKEDYRITGPFINKIIDSVGYVYYGSFSRYISGDDMVYVLKRFEKAKGVIIDVRNNGGGSLINAFTMISYLADTKRWVYSSYLKSGPSHQDFSPENKVYIEPDKEYTYPKKIVVLTNRSSYSATTFFAAMCKAFPNITIMGDTTGGGGGIPAGDELPNGWYFRYSASKTLLPDGWNIELGVPPDIVVYMKKEDIDLGLDTILESAIAYLQ